MNIIELSGVSHTFESGSDSNLVLSDVNLKVADGEFVAIVGFSGAGKSTLVAILAGLLDPALGGVIFKGKQIDGPGPERGVVFQSYSLMPWLSVRGNVALATNNTRTKLSARQQQEHIDHYIDMVGLSHAQDRKPAELSGGMQQRVAVARALALQPDVLILDEPLSANDVDEALLLADRVITLTPAPAATFDCEFKVSIPHPRDRAAMNHNDDFVALRGQITRHLLLLSQRRENIQTQDLHPPTVVPISRMPKAVIEAAHSPRQNRFLEFSDTGKIYPTNDGDLAVVKDFSLSMDKGEFVTLIGHSGCGKSTVLSMTAGLNLISQGGIILDGLHVSEAGPDRAVVFQSPSLMPWMTAYENVMLGVEQVYPNASAAERADVVAYYLSRVGLADTMHRKAADLSNGMQQRAGIARAFALSPKLLLLDEPFGMLDSLTRWELQEVLMDVWARTEVTAICVTHDVDEAILLADRVVMMSNGPEAQVGNIMSVDLPRPRSREALTRHPDYYAYREELLEFLEAYEGGANPSDELLQAIVSRRQARTDSKHTDNVLKVQA